MLIDLRGQTFGRLTALEYSTGSRWRCKCACGAHTVVQTYSLRSGQTRSCGCLRGAKDDRKSPVTPRPRHRMITIDGVTRPLFEWCREYGIYSETVRGRLDRGMSPKEAFTTPVARRERRQD